ncbi:SNF2-related protein [Planctopirus limnophila DSM 3776]|uniref:SNF2-related protein n=1 Tax=Planctopirus limnophila (strain ATCC 43296 / DSM 3776 / IFAM 1008 / Mu 290) TaxID=521674 RepID=D5SNL5_PLAL2|nr:DEAD/DEAH box helicase [Planctopirus limnophila]ADG68129.1 SNF2-related protein [Planctopirus limnophila DSM 3776]
MTLSDLLESKFRGDIRFRGAAYIQAERVAINRITEDQIFGAVRDGVEFVTQLMRDEGQLKMSCTCMAGKPNPTGQASCKHVWATILLAEKQGVISSGVKPGFIPAFITEDEPLDLPDEDWLDDELEATPSRKLSLSKSTAVAERPTPVSAPAREWETRLKELRTAMQDGTGSYAVSAPGKEREVVYEVDPAASEEAECLILQTSQRQRRASGQWGKLKPLKLRPGRLEEIEDEEDRRILAHLVGGTPDRSSTTGMIGEMQAAAWRYRVPHDLTELLLPQICATGRIRFTDPEERMTEPLVWDGGEPWELCLALEFDQGQDLWKLRGFLRRGEESRGLETAQMLTPGGLVILDHHISLFNDFGAYAWVKLLKSGQPLEVPAGEEHDLVDRLHDMPALPRLELPDELKLEEVRLSPQPLLLVHSPGKSKWHHERLKADVIFEYEDATVRGSSVQWAIVQRSARRYVVRDRDLEDTYWSALQDVGVRRLIDARRGPHDVEITARDLGPAVRKLIGQGWEVRADGKQVRQPGELKFQVKSGIDWFELHADIDFGGSRVSFPELLSALARGDSTVYLDDGSLGILPEEWVHRYGLMGGLGVLEGDHLKFGAAQVGLLDALLLDQGSVDYDAKFAQVRERLANFNGVQAARKPQGFQGELRGYQLEGVGWLQFLDEFQFGGCLADDMGLGKTIQMLAFLEERRQGIPAKNRLPSLVVVPKSLMFNWKQEAERFTPQLKVLEYSGLDRAKQREAFTKSDLVLATYGTLRRDIHILKDVDFDYVILDEAQAIKNNTSQVAKATRLLKSVRRVALSGTPIENHLGDLCSIFDFLNPGMLGRSSLFKLHAADPNDRETRKVLAHGLRPFILRRTKQAVANELPDKIEQTIYCEMGEEQQRLYDELRDHFRDSLLGLIESQGLAKTKMHVLEALLRLRQASCHPALLHKSSDEEGSAKLDVLIPHLEELVGEGHKTLVFSQFTSMLAIVRKHLDRAGITYEYLDGQTRDRKECVERFQNDKDCGVFLISLKAGGLGLNLTAADYVFILDPWWNPAVETQAIDRAHRVGQTRQVFAYRLICKNTVEEKIAELQKQKRELADAILEQDNSVMTNLTADDLRMLLS